MLLIQAREWSSAEVAENASCVLECCRVVLASSSAGHEEQLICLKWMAGLVKYVPVFELETDIIEPFLSSVNKYLGEIFEVFEDVIADVKDELLCLINILLSLSIKVAVFVREEDRAGNSDMSSLGRLLPLLQLRTKEKFAKMIAMNSQTQTSAVKSRVLELQENLVLLSKITPEQTDPSKVYMEAEQQAWALKLVKEPSRAEALNTTDKVNVFGSIY